MIESLKAEFAVGLMCRGLNLSRSGYYQWKKRPPSPRHQAREALAVEVKRVFDDEKARAGSPRIAKRLNEEGHRSCRQTVANIMKAHGWRAKAAKKYKATTNSNHSLPVAPNRLAQNFETYAPDQKWVSDITYIWTDEGWLYLAVVLELYSRKVIGWTIAERMTATLVCDALMMALWRRKFKGSSHLFLAATNQHIHSAWVKRVGFGLGEAVIMSTCSPKSGHSVGCRMP